MYMTETMACHMLWFHPSIPSPSRSMVRQVAVTVVLQDNNINYICTTIKGTQNMCYTHKNAIECIISLETHAVWGYTDLQLTRHALLLVSDSNINRPPTQDGQTGIITVTHTYNTVYTYLSECWFRTLPNCQRVWGIIQ